MKRKSKRKSIIAFETKKIEKEKKNSERNNQIRFCCCCLCIQIEGRRRINSTTFITKIDRISSKKKRKKNERKYFSEQKRIKMKWPPPTASVILYLCFILKNIQTSSVACSPVQCVYRVMRRAIMVAIWIYTWTIWPERDVGQRRKSKCRWTKWELEKMELNKNAEIERNV